MYGRYATNCYPDAQTVGATNSGTLTLPYCPGFPILTIVFKVVAKGMVDRGKRGAIVHISSTASQRAAENQLSYCASKGALDQVMRVMALELGPSQVNHVSLSVTATERMGMVQQIYVN